MSLLIQIDPVPPEGLIHVNPDCVKGLEEDLYLIKDDLCNFEVWSPRVRAK